MLFVSCSVLGPAMALIGSLCADQKEVGHARHVMSETIKFDHVNLEGLPNAIRVYAGLISGGKPGSTSGFQSLAKLGVKTIVSVDGIEPDVAAANALGMRYVHLPVGYRKISAERARELAHVLLTLEDPVYIHCHHGRHRGPTAAAVGCVTAGLMSNQLAVALLRDAGTSPSYHGLFRSAKEARQVTKTVLLNMSPELPQKAEVGTLVEVMVHLDEELVSIQSVLATTSDSLKVSQIESLLEDSTLLADEFKELLRHQFGEGFDDGFRDSLRLSRNSAERLAELVVQSRGTVFEGWRSKANGYVKAISRQCTSCHKTYRNND